MSCYLKRDLLLPQGPLMNVLHLKAVISYNQFPNMYNNKKKLNGEDSGIFGGATPMTISLRITFSQSAPV